jgi:ABC transporter substrate binding protein
MPTPAVVALQRETLEIPIVFAALADPIGSGFIASLSRPGGNITGVMQYEPSVTCPFRKSYPDVLMMQSGQDWNGDNDTGPLDCSMQGRIFL